MTDHRFWDDAPIIFRYTWQQGVEDGSLIKVFENRWQELSGGKPILATIAPAPKQARRALTPCA